MSYEADVQFGERTTAFQVQFANVGKDGAPGGYYVPSGEGGVLKFTPSKADMPAVGDVPLPEGEPGKAFTYEDFTPEQLETLKGKDGVSPEVEVSAIDGGHRVSITDANGTESFDVMDGEDGEGGGGVFPVAYGASVTAQEVIEAYDAGKHCVVTSGRLVLPLTLVNRDQSIVQFSGPGASTTTGATMYYTLNEASWSNGSFTPQAPITGTSGQFVVIGSNGKPTTKTISAAEGASF